MAQIREKLSYIRHFPRGVPSFLVTISGHGPLFSRNLSKEDRIEMRNVMEHTFAALSLKWALA